MVCGFSRLNGFLLFDSFVSLIQGYSSTAFRGKILAARAISERIFYTMWTLVNMESWLGMSLYQAIRNFVSNPLVFLKTLFTFWWLKIINRQRRLHVYDEKVRELESFGTVIPQVERQLEPPREILDTHTTDSVFVYGGNSAGDVLVARVCREQGGHVFWLYLKLSDGRVYQPPNHEKSSPPGENFNAGGLKIKCLLPMRKWRVSYNGILGESREDGSSTRMVHVKFNFICLSSSFVYDLSTDINPSVLAKFLSETGSSAWPSNPRRVTRYLDRYVQSVNLLGTVSIEGAQETEVFLWGARQRSHDVRGCRQMSSSLFEFFGYTKDGQLVYSGEYKFPGYDSKLSFGFRVERISLWWPTLDCKHYFYSDHENFSGMRIELKTERTELSAEVGIPTASVKWLSGLTRGQRTLGHLTSFKLQDGDYGHALALNHVWPQKAVGKIEKPEWRLPLMNAIKADCHQKALLSLEDIACQNSSLSGGKGASLAALAYLARKFKTSFKVSPGFVLTTSAYQKFISHADIRRRIALFESKSRSLDTENLEESCKLLVTKLSSLRLPEAVEDAIRRQFLEKFPDNVGTKRKFAVRSSATGEDSEELSAAGQMTTYLGVVGVENIFQAVSKCWASQFAFSAIQYKRQNGQELNSPMAVVVQEMVAADVAGVLFTCDPVTGNPANITLTANYGLGESVVSAAADPDTIVLHRDENNVISAGNVQIGKKKMKIVMADEGDVVERFNSENYSNVCCLTSDQCKKLAEICVKVEKAYGFPVDIEWAFDDNQLYLLQARPVTTIDRETKFELVHGIDSGLRSEDEYNTAANVGEVMPGALSYLGITFCFKFIKFLFHELYYHRNPYAFPFNPFKECIPVSQNHVFIGMTDFVMRFYKKGQQSLLSESNIISGFGRLLDDPEMFDHVDRRNRCYPTTFVPYQLIFFIKDLITADKKLTKATEKLWKEEMDLTMCSNAKEMYLEVWRRVVETTYGSARHMENTGNSSLYNSFLLTILAKNNGGWDATVFSDFALILSSCGGVESADIPATLQLITKEIRKCPDVEKFKNMETQDALVWLETTSSPAGFHYKEFIRKHGHRCLKEFDVHSKPWRLDRLPVVRILQESIDLPAESPKKNLTTEEVLDKIKVPLTRKSRFFLKLLLPASQRAVFNRERSKSLMIKHFDFARKGFTILADQMVKEGRLPDSDLMYYLSSHELLELIETRSAFLVQSAVRRRQIFPELDKIRFPEITKGVPIAMNTSRNYDDDLESDLELIGTPVSQGVIKAIARVAVSLKEASLIQPGEVLIAYSTDIAWSTYFPLLSGVATELGGLISHGAVVAREYGLPCVVGVHDATVRFKSGDLVLLDGNKGILKRVNPKSKETVNLENGK